MQRYVEWDMEPPGGRELPLKPLPRLRCPKEVNRIQSKIWPKGAWRTYNPYLNIRSPIPNLFDPCQSFVAFYLTHPSCASPFAIYSSNCPVYA